MFLDKMNFQSLSESLSPYLYTSISLSRAYAPVESELNIHSHIYILIHLLFADWREAAYNVQLRGRRDQEGTQPSAHGTLMLTKVIPA